MVFNNAASLESIFFSVIDAMIKQGIDPTDIIQTAIGCSQKAANQALQELADLHILENTRLTAESSEFLHESVAWDRTSPDNVDFTPYHEQQETHDEAVASLQTRSDNIERMAAQIGEFALISSDWGVHFDNFKPRQYESKVAAVETVLKHFDLRVFDEPEEKTAYLAKLRFLLSLGTFSAHLPAKVIKTVSKSELDDWDSQDDSDIPF